MTATITKISKVPSKFGGSFFYLFFKGADGKSYKCCVYPKYRNYSIWKPLCENGDRAVGVICEGLVVKDVLDNLIDADYLSKTRVPKKLDGELVNATAKIGG